MDSFINFEVIHGTVLSRANEILSEGKFNIQDSEDFCYGIPFLNKSCNQYSCCIAICKTKFSHEKKWGVLKAQLNSSKVWNLYSENGKKLSAQIMDKIQKSAPDVQVTFKDICKIAERIGLADLIIRNFSKNYLPINYVYYFSNATFFIVLNKNIITNINIEEKGILS